ncbi:hypothetical protein SESBI_46641 [Sesbania bispinosa]|nr:hypothetical protein SESBI_46641 [Sesbania bispinosa]
MNFLRGSQTPNPMPRAIIVTTPKATENLVVSLAGRIAPPELTDQHYKSESSTIFVGIGISLILVVIASGKIVVTVNPSFKSSLALIMLLHTKDEEVGATTRIIDPDRQYLWDKTLT